MSRIPRNRQVTVKLTEEKREQLDEHAKSLGIGSSTLVAFVIGQYLHQQEAVISPLVEELKSVAHNAISKVSESD